MISNKVFVWLNLICKKIDRLGEFTGKCLAWIVIFMVVLVGYDVTMRYFFQSGSIALQELEWHLFSIIFLLGAAYTFKHDDHVRLDLVYQSRFMTDSNRAWINLIGGLMFLTPFCILVIYSSWPFVYQAYIYAEGSPDPGGLPYRWLLKATIPLGFSLLLLQGIADIFRNLLHIMDKS